MKSWVIVASALAAGIAGTAGAQDNGAYVMVGAGLARYGEAAKDLQDQTVATGCNCSGDTDDNASLLKLGAGYRFGPHFALETTLLKSDKFVRTVHSSPEVVREMTVSAVNVSLVGISSHENQELNVRFGGAYWENVRAYRILGAKVRTDQDSGVDVTLGVGYTWYFARPLGLFIDWDYLPTKMTSSTNETVTLSIFSLGLKAAF